MPGNLQYPFSPTPKKEAGNQREEFYFFSSIDLIESRCFCFCRGFGVNPLSIPCLLNTGEGKKKPVIFKLLPKSQKGWLAFALFVSFQGVPILFCRVLTLQ